MDEEILIKIVREYRELYDTEHKMYEDHSKREAAWQEISTRVHVPASECRDRWKRIRDNYRKAKKLRQIKRTQGVTKIKKIKHAKVLSFLDQFLASNLSDPETPNTPSSTFLLNEHEHADTNSESLDPLQPVIVEQPTNNKPDTLVTFFTNLGETVKTFPEEVQIRVKRDIFKIINEAEEDVCRSKVKNTDFQMKFEAFDD